MNTSDGLQLFARIQNRFDEEYMGRLNKIQTFRTVAQWQQQTGDIHIGILKYNSIYFRTFVQLKLFPKTFETFSVQWCCCYCCCFVCMFFFAFRKSFSYSTRTYFKLFNSLIEFFESASECDFCLNECLF